MSVILWIRSGFFMLASKNSMGLISKYSHIYRKADKEGEVRPELMDWI